jgi:hypothetical protein
MTTTRAESPGTHMIVLPAGGYAEHAPYEAEPADHVPLAPRQL